MQTLDRITIDPEMMGGKPCIRGMRVTVNMIVGVLSTSMSRAKFLEHYPYLEDADLDQALAYRQLNPDAFEEVDEN